MKQKTKHLLLILLLTGIVLLSAGCGRQNNAEKQYRSVSDLKGARIGVVNGSAFDRIAEEHIEDAVMCYYMSNIALPAGTV